MPLSRLPGGRRRPRPSSARTAARRLSTGTTALVSLALLTVGATGALVAPPVAAPPASAATAATAATGVDDRPNLLLITSDDQTDYEMRWMPRTRRLLTRHGVDVVDAVSPHPLCCPARAEILTGEYAHNNGVRHNVGPHGGWAAFERAGHAQQNLGTWLQDAGYETGFVGKMLNGYHRSDRAPAGFDVWNPSIAQTYAYYGTTFLNDGRPETFEKTHVADAVRDYSVDYVRDFADTEKPFFLWVSHVGPHGATKGPPVPAVRHRGMFENVVLPATRKPSHMEADVSDKPSTVRTARTRSAAVNRKVFRARLQTLQSIDEANAALLAALRRTGELDDTIVVYTSDNGYLLGEHRLSGKNVPYTEALQVPLVVRGPGIPEGRQVDGVLTTVDLAPTFLSYAGVLGDVRAQGRTDGADMRPVLRGTARASTTQLVQGGTESSRELAAYGWKFRGVLAGRWTYARWWTGEEELYDNRRDPYQLVNLAGHRGYRPVLRDLRGRLRQLGTCRGAQRCEAAFGPVTAPRAGTRPPRAG